MSMGQRKIGSPSGIAIESMILWMSLGGVATTLGEEGH